MKRQRNKTISLLILLLIIGIGFAALATTLKINGNAHINKNTWSIYWTNRQVVDGSVSSTIPSIEESEEHLPNTKATWSVTLRNPGDYYEFTIDAINKGTIDAMVTNVTSTIDGKDISEKPNYLKYSVTYDDGREIENNQPLGCDLSETYKVSIYYDVTNMTKEEIESIPEEGITHEFEFEVTYEMATDEVIKSNFKVGDYFELVPDKEEATTTTEGFSGTTPTADQTLWRVIKLNADGTVDAVSEYISTNNITITGVDGYRNLVAGLEDIASCYSKEDYTIKTRMMGYGGQTPSIEDTYYFNGVNNKAPQASSTSSPTTGAGHEYKDGLTGDTLYLRDYQLVKNTYNNLTATKKEGSSARYWLASRYYYYYTATRFYYSGRAINNGNLVNGGPSSNFDPRWYNSGWNNASISACVRPIITLKEGIDKESGSGSKTDPYILK